MRWIIHPEVRKEERALNFCREFADNFDTGSLDWLRVDLVAAESPAHTAVAGIR